MATPDFDPMSLSVDERLLLIQTLWKSIEEAVANGDASVARAVEQWRNIDVSLLAEIEREADEAEADPSSQTSWATLLAELKHRPV